jgi:hypothetical protein
LLFIDLGQDNQVPTRLWRIMATEWLEIMAKRKRRAGQASEIIVLPGRMTDMLARTQFNIDRALKAHSGKAFKGAAATCRRCTASTECRRWLESHQEGAANPVPNFCPNAPFIRANRRRGKA